MSDARWEHLPHGADIGVRGIGRTKAEAFEQTALALTAITTDPSSIVAHIAVEIECAANDDELLLVEWLNALIYEMATRKMLFAKFAVDIRDHCLTAKVWGEAIDLDKHEAAVEVKGATCTALKVAQGGDGYWRAQCVIDV
jgi:tRNA nucleotidyltransferase (CCA-adding enzyme)